MKRSAGGSINFIRCIDEEPDPPVDLQSSLVLDEEMMVLYRDVKYARMYKY
jgi:hypothetical protein